MTDLEGRVNAPQAQTPFSPEEMRHLQMYNLLLNAFEKLLPSDAATDLKSCRNKYGLYIILPILNGKQSYVYN